jgi:hypothetical protein
MGTISVGGVVIKFAEGVPNYSLRFKSIREMTDYLFEQYFSCSEQRKKVVLCGVNGSVFKAVSQGFQRRGFERGLEIEVRFSPDKIWPSDGQYVVDLPWFVSKVERF